MNQPYKGIMTSKVQLSCFADNVHMYVLLKKNSKHWRIIKVQKVIRDQFQPFAFSTPQHKLGANHLVNLTWQRKIRQGLYPDYPPLLEVS